MKNLVCCLSLLFFCSIIFICAQPVLAEDMREVSSKAEQAKAALIQKAAEEKRAAEEEAAKSKARILGDRTKLESAIANLKAREKSLKAEIEALTKEQTVRTTEEEELTVELAQTDQMVNELIGVIRINAKDISTLIEENLQTAFGIDSLEKTQQLADESTFPGMDGIRGLAQTLFTEIDTTGEVTLKKMQIIDRNGKTVEAETLVMGPFCAAYRLDGELGFLRYSTAGKQFYALSKLPTRRMQKQLARYFDGESESLPMDITRGAALQQLSHSLSLWEQIQKGGPIVWPILAIFIVGILITLERIIFMTRKSFNSDTFMASVGQAAEKGKWDECETYCNKYLKKPVARIIAAGLNCRDVEREDMENVLQEAILREIPPMERFLSTLGMLAAISPLLGLLGTVTGMIDTFHIITLHGTGDPKLMSGGISEALVTTMLGLGVAIPLMLAQTLLNRSVEKEIGTMEEKAVSLVNVIYKSRIETCKT